jgi:TIR domain
MAVAPRMRGAAIQSIAPQLFLSHSSQDARLASGLAQDLNICAIDVWFDAWELRTGDDLHGRIAEAVAKSKFVGVLVGLHFSGSKWVKGEVHQALTREMAEERTLVLPLLIDGAPIPDVLSTKLYLDLTGDLYFPALSRLAGLIHDVESQTLEDSINAIGPFDLGGVIRVLRHCGVDPYCVVGTRTIDEIEAAGGHRSENRIQFDPEEIRSHPAASPSLQALMDRLVVAWADEP